MYLTARPRSAMQQVPFFFTKMFLDLMSLWAIAGFPVNTHKFFSFFRKTYPYNIYIYNMY